MERGTDEADMEWAYGFAAEWELQAEDGGVSTRRRPMPRPWCDSTAPSKTIHGKPTRLSALRLPCCAQTGRRSLSLVRWKGS
jgi:hypothetical protein